MAFKLDQSPSYLWPVTVPIVEQDGACVDYTFGIQFKRMLQSEIEKVIEEFQEPDPALKLRDTTFCERYVVGWDLQLQSSDGTPLVFSKDALASLLDIARVATVITLAWFESIKIGQEKNSQKPPEPGPPPPVVQH